MVYNCSSLRYSEAEVDVTGVTEISVNNSYTVVDGSVLIQDDDNKYGCLDESSSDSHTSDNEDDETGISVRYRIFCYSFLMF